MPSRPPTSPSSSSRQTSYRSDYCVGKEWRRARELSDDGNLVMVPVLISPCFFTPLVGDIQILPPGATPVKEHASEDAAYLAVVKHLHELVEAQLEQRSGALPDN